MKIRIVLLAVLAAVSSPLQAKWYEASSKHFVIYADDSESDIRTYAQNLEKYHAAMAYVSGQEIVAPSPSNRVTIFVVGSQRDIRKLQGSDSRSIAGFYVPRAGASRAFVQDIRNKRGYPHISTVILLHEYAHHFLASTSRYAKPRWLSEGAAEFFAAASFNNDGSVQLGRPAQHRSNELIYADDVSVNELLDENLYKEKRGKKYDAFYGMSWALYHYLTFSEERRGQFARYWALLTEGESSIDAAKDAFGDIDALDRDVGQYLRQRRMFNFRLGPELIAYGPISIRELPEGEAEMMKVRMVSQRGVNREQALELVEEARAIAAEYPDDPGVLTALAEAEFDAGNDDAAIAAADRAIALDPGRPNAYVQKGYALFRKAEEAEDRDAAYNEAMMAFSALNKLERDHPQPLIYYYRSFVERGLEPNETARHALERASQLSPFDRSLAMTAALMHAGEGKIELARLGLKPLASNPHGGSLAKQAAEFLSQMETADEGTSWYPRLERIEVTVEPDGEIGSDETETPALP